MSETGLVRNEVLQFCNGMGLDLGCGGDKVCPQAIGFDLPVPYVDFGKSKAEMRGDARSLPFNDDVLDYVYSSHLLEDFPNTKEVVAEWLRVLKVGGVLILYLPDEQVFRRHCASTGQGYNGNHSVPNMSLSYMRDIMGSFRTMEIMAVEHHYVYSFLLVVRKTVKDHQ